METIANSAAAHEARVVIVSGRYNFRPVCSCGWESRGYVAEHAAQLVADDHAAQATADAPRAVFGSGRISAARKAYADLLNARKAYESAGGAFAPEACRLRLRTAQELRAAYAEYGDSVLG